MPNTSQMRSAAARHDPRWDAVKARDASADGRFFYSVRTTGVYCRPSCGARLARVENVAFHSSARAAERAGFRPCKRCKPDQTPAAERDAQRIVAMCRFIESQQSPPTLAQLGQHVGLSAFHAQRVFKAATGVTPRAYAAAQRRTRVRDTLRATPSVTAAIYDAGFNSAGRFYTHASALLGMTPSEHRAGGVQQAIRFAVGECSLGSFLVAASARGVCAIALGDDPQALLHELERSYPRATLLGADAGFEALVAQAIVQRIAVRDGESLPR